jgi:hypothetical protein
MGVKPCVDGGDLGKDPRQLVRIREPQDRLQHRTFQLMRRVELIPNEVGPYVVTDEEITVENGEVVRTGEEIREGMETGCPSPAVTLDELLANQGDRRSRPPGS